MTDVQILGLVLAGVALLAGGIGSLAVEQASGWNAMSNRVVGMRYAITVIGMVTAAVVVGLAFKEDPAVLFATAVAAAMAPVLVILSAVVHVRVTRITLYRAAVRGEELPRGVSRDEAIRWGQSHRIKVADRGTPGRV